jgi:flagellar hook-associated protein 2
MSSSIPSLSASISGSFAGVSKFATSLQSVLNRSVGIAALPLQSLNAGLTTLTQRQSAFQTLEANFLSLQQSISSLQNVLKTNILNSSISDGSVVSASVAAGALPGSYTIEVESLGAFSTALSTGGAERVTDPAVAGVSSDASLTLQVGTTSITVTPESDTLSALADAINAQAADQVQATVVNVGSTSSPDYRLSLRAVKLGADAIDLTGSSGSLISASSAGAPASYKLNGLASSVTSDSRTVTLAPGLTVDLLSQSPAGKAATITVSHNSAGVASALSSFTKAYNAAADALAQHHGESAGVLQGESILLTLANTLARLSSYSGGSAETSLAAYGVQLDKSGHLSLDNTTFSAAAKSSFAGLLTTLGNTESTGFLKTATDLLSELEDVDTGVFKGQSTSLAAAISEQKNKMNIQQDRVAALQTSLTAQLAKADAAIARLESQVSYITGLFAAFTKNSSSGSS